MTSPTIDLWFVNFDQPRARYNELSEWLSPDATARALRFSQTQHTHRWTVARGALRGILATYTGTTPDKIRFHVGTNGKPSLDNNLVEFNLSHSGARAVVGVTTLAPIGVDIEHVRTISDMSAVAQRFFSPREQRAFEVLPAALRCEGFFNCWTRKESFIKATGEGLQRPLDSFDASLTPNAPVHIESIDGDSATAEQWTLRHFSLATEYIAALAVASREPFTVRQYEY